MSQSYAMQKKIANLTKIIYNLNVKYETCNEDLQELSRVHADTISKHKDEVAQLCIQHEDELLKQEVLNKTKERDRYLKDVETLRKRLQSEHDTQIENLKNKHEAAMALSSNACASLKKQVEECHSQIKSLEQEHTVELDRLKRESIQEKDAIQDSMDSRLSTLDSEYKRRVEELKLSFEHKAQKEASQREIHWMNQLREVESDLNYKHALELKIVRESLMQKLEHLSSESVCAKEEIATLSSTLTRKEQIIEEKAVVIKHLETSLEQGRCLLETECKRSKTEEMKFMNRESQLNTTIKKLSNRISTLSKLPETIENMKSERDQIRQRLFQANNHSLKLSSEIQDMKANFKSRSDTLKADYKCIRCLVLQVKEAQNELKGDISNFIQNTLASLKKMTLLYEQEKQEYMNRSQIEIETLIQANRFEQAKENQRILTFQKDLDECYKELDRREAQLNISKSKFHLEKRQLQDEIEALKATAKSCKEQLSFKEHELLHQKEQYEQKAENYESRIKEHIMNYEAIQSKYLLLCSEVISCRHRLKTASKTMQSQLNEWQREKEMSQRNLLLSQRSCQNERLNLKGKIENIESDYSKEIATLICKHKDRIQAIQTEHDIKLREMERTNDKIKMSLQAQHDNEFKDKADQHQKDINYLRVELTNTIELSQNELNLCKMEIGNLQSLLEQKTEECREQFNIIQSNNKEISLLRKDAVRTNVVHENELKKKGRTINDLLRDRDNLIDSNRAAMRKADELNAALRNANQKVEDTGNEMLALKNDMCGELKTCETNLQQKLCQLRRHQEARLLKDHLILSMKQKIKQISNEMNEVIQRKDNEIKNFNIRNIKEKKLMDTQHEQIRKRYEAMLQLMSKDLEYVKFRLMNRESKPEDIFNIRALEAELHKTLEREKLMKKEMAYYKNELKNREENFTSIFTGGSIDKQVKPYNLQRTDSIKRNVKEKENQHPSRRRNTTRKVHKM